MSRLIVKDGKDLKKKRHISPTPISKHSFCRIFHILKQRISYFCYFFNLNNVFIDKGFFGLFLSLRFMLYLVSLRLEIGLMMAVFIKKCFVFSFNSILN